MKLPNKVKIGSIPWTVEQQDKLWSAKGGVLGQCQGDAKLIEVLTEGTIPQEVARVFIHELLHAIWYEYDIGEPVDEEKAVTQLATGLAAVMADNPIMILNLIRLLRTDA